ncbi:hypothetical protein BGY98DRAFT_1050124 [Russula aff. rugulosa BPL654]|nr:hypothetical protein BGY98DRAFT_1050124 [Russula aff. rugulosa BPL654]
MLLFDHESSWRRVTALSLSALLGRCRSTLVGYVADHGNPGPALSGTAAPFDIDTLLIEAQVEQQQQRHQAVDASTPWRHGQHAEWR